MPIGLAYALLFTGFRKTSPREEMFFDVIQPALQTLLSAKNKMLDEKSYNTLKKSIFTSMLLVPFIPFMLILGIGFYYFKNSIETGTLSHMKRIAEDHRQMIEGFLDERRSDLEFIAASYTYPELIRSEKLRFVFERLQNKSNAFVDLGVFNTDGIHVAYYGPYRLAGKSYKNATWFQEAIGHGCYISDVFPGYRKIPHFVLAIMKEDRNGKWLIRATIDTHAFSRLVNEVRIGTTGEAYILNKKGVFQTKRRSGGDLMKKPPDHFAAPFSESGVSTFILKNTKGVKHLYATAWMKEKSWLLIVRQEKSDAFQTLHAAVYLTILIIVLGGMSIITSAYYLTDRIIQRLEKKDVEKEILSNQLIGASRLAELGEMAAGFAHEINNPLQIIKNEHSLIETILSEMKEAGKIQKSDSLSELEDSADQIRLQVSRCSDITQAILKFGRQGTSIARDIDLRKFIPETIAMIKKKAAVHGISIFQDIDGAKGKVHADPSRLQQVLLNLFNNAIYAIIERHGASGGELSVEAVQKSRDTIELRVKDNGCGIRSENLEKIFSPFFTTKPVGKGTGMGLSVCYGIIENMGGIMEVSSEVGIGTLFSIQLPGRA